MISITCCEPMQAHKAMMQTIWPALKAATFAGQRMVLELKQEGRTGKENRLLHAMLGYISENMEWAGAKRDVETWKRLLTAAWCRAKNEQIEFLPALDGNGVDIVFRRTSQLTKAECADLIEFIFAWGSQNDVKFPVVE
jgi:hypothetical protein